MSLLRALILGVVQGLTEFLPVSSSAHLQLVPWLFGWDSFNDDSVSQAFDVALHLGTLSGAVAYLYRDVIRLVRAGFASFATIARREPLSDDARFAWLLVVASIPASVAGAVLGDALTSDRIGITAFCLAFFGLVLAAADRMSVTRNADQVRLPDAIALGLGQALALQPGVSRSGITMTVARARGFDRVSASRISFLMSLPIIAGAGLYTLMQIGGIGGIPAADRAAFVVGMVSSAITGWFAVWGMLRWVARTSFDVFAIYRLLLGAAVLIKLALI